MLKEPLKTTNKKQGEERNNSNNNTDKGYIAEMETKPDRRHRLSRQDTLPKDGVSVVAMG